MKNKLKKDLSQRKLFNQLEIPSLVAKSINKSNLGVNRIHPTIHPRTKIRNRCLWTGRGRGVLKDFKMCRMVLKLWGDSGKIEGMRKR